MIKLKILFWSIVLKIKAAFKLINVKNYKALHLMQIVKYNGKKYIINNMTKTSSDGIPLADITPMIEPDGKLYPQIVAPIPELKKTFCWHNIYLSLFSSYNHYMFYWFKIDLREHLKGYGGPL